MADLVPHDTEPRLPPPARSLGPNLTPLTTRHVLTNDPLILLVNYHNG
jgi:hypothetical protein